MTQKNNNCPGYYHVSGYTTQDGKQVDDYTRQCWKHGGGGVSENESHFKNRRFL